MRSRFGTFLIASAALAATAIGFSPAPALALVINPTDARGIRDFPDDAVGPFLLDFLAFKSGTEDRTVLEFNVSSLSGIVPTTTLDLPLANFDAGGPTGGVDVFTFFGNGTVTSSPVPVPIAGLQPFTQITAGGGHTCGVTAAGAVWCWGADTFGQTGRLL